MLNTSTRAVEDVSLMLRMPDELSFTYTTEADPNASSSCGNGVCTGGEEGLWNLGTLDAGASTFITVEPNVAEALAVEGTLIASQFSVYATDMNPYRASATQPVDVGSAAELTLTASADAVVPGESFTYDLFVGQVGAQALLETELRLELPAGVVVQSISDGGVADSDGSIVWDLETVAVAGTAYRSVEVELVESLDSPRGLSARAELRHQGGLELDAQAETSIATTAEALPLEVSFEVSPESIVADSRVLLTTTITNTSARSVDGVELLLRVPYGVSFVYTTDADPDATASCGNGTCSAGEEGRVHAWRILAALRQAKPGCGGEQGDGIGNSTRNLECPATLMDEVAGSTADLFHVKTDAGGEAPLLHASNTGPSAPEPLRSGSGRGEVARAERRGRAGYQ